MTSKNNPPITIAIVIPARFGSKRFEGKPLAKIGSLSMLQHTCQSALSAQGLLNNLKLATKISTKIIVATEDQRVLDHAKSISGVTAVMTPDSCPTGSDRVLKALELLNLAPEIIINLQGDAPFTPAHFISQIASALIKTTDCSVATPIVNLSWEDLDDFRENKKITPFSGTTVITNSRQQAIWFSKNIIPAIRQEEKLREKSEFSPVYQHIGLYGFKLDALKKFVALKESIYEQLEGLEQLRLLENGIAIHAEEVSYGEHPPMPGIDTLEDLKRTVELLKKTGRLI